MDSENSKNLLSESSINRIIYHSLEGNSFNLHIPEIDIHPVITKITKVCDIEDYIINENATIIFWDDDTKTVVKKSKDDKFDARLGFLTAYFQKHCGMSKTQANKFLDNLKIKESKGE